MAHDVLITLKYLGDHLALSLQAPQRRYALASHYEIMPGVLRPAALDALRQGLLIWRKNNGNGAPLLLTLEPSKLAPMEGELQLRFSFKSDLCVLTFLVAQGDAFGLDPSTILFVGGVQGRVGGREELREACKLNGEISPAAMLMLAVQAVARAIGVSEIIGIGEDDQISMDYSRPRISFDYHRFWTEAGGIRRGRHYGVPLETPHKPISETSPSHRSRTRRKREAKSRIRRSIETQLRRLINGPLTIGRAADAPA
jgi:uncharacterized protein VirK/YbjX